MQPQPLERRVERLEQRVALLEELPARMDRLESQFLQLREEMRGEFSAMQVELRAGDEETRRVLHEEIQSVMTHARVLHEDIKATIRVMNEGRSTDAKRRTE